MGQLQNHLALTNNHNPGLFLSITLNQPFSYAGTIIQGAVNVGSLAGFSPKALNLIIEGTESVSWQQKVYTINSPYIKSSFTDSRITYKTELNLAEFSQKIQATQLIFPFSVLLPKALPASVDIGCSFIKYLIIAQMHADNNMAALKTSKKLEVREPPRGELILLQDSKIFKTICCGYGCFGGSITLSLSTDISHIECGKPFKVKGMIETSSSPQIASYAVVLRKKVNLVSKYQYKAYQCKDIVLFEANKTIKADCLEQFQQELKLPSQFNQYTAIGNILSRTYFITLVVYPKNSCFQSSALQIHAVVVCCSSATQESQSTILTGEWAPVIKSKRCFFNLQPYFYNPSSFIKINNQEGKMLAHQMAIDLPTAQTLQRDAKI